MTSPLLLRWILAFQKIETCEVLMNENSKINPSYSWDEEIDPVELRKIQHNYSSHSDESAENVPF